MPPTSLDFVPPANFRWLGLPQQQRHSRPQFPMFVSFVSTVIDFPDGNGQGKKRSVLAHRFKDMSVRIGREGRQSS